MFSVIYVVFFNVRFYYFHARGSPAESASSVCELGMTTLASPQCVPFFSSWEERGLKSESSIYRCSIRVDCSAPSAVTIDPLHVHTYIHREGTNKVIIILCQLQIAFQTVIEIITLCAWTPTCRHRVLRLHCVVETTAAVSVARFCSRERINETATYSQCGVICVCVHCS